jgi:MFS family permease
MATDSKPRRRIDWVYSVFPISLASGPIGTVVTLYLLELNKGQAGLFYVSLAAAIFSAVGIPASIFWGSVTDRIHRRRAMIVVSYAIVAFVLLSMYVDKTTRGTILTYAAFSFFSAASATPMNLLIMETEKKGRWAGTFAKLSMMSSVGNVVGLLISTIWVEALPLLILSIPLGIFSLASAVLAALTIHEPAFVLERETMVLRKPSFFSRLLALPVFFLTIPKVSDFRRAFRGLRYSLTSYVPLFYISTVLFYFSSGLFNTSFVPAMRSFGLLEGETFAVILAGMVVQTLTFRFAGRYVGEKSLVMSSVQGLLLRGLCYGGIGAAALFIQNYLFLAPALVLYPLAGGVAFAIYYTSANTMMFNTVQKRNPGAALGVYSAVVGLASTAGSLVSGLVSAYSGFSITFTVASVLLYLAVLVVSRLPRNDKPDTGSSQ